CLDWEDLDDDGDGVLDEVDLCHRALDPLFDDVSDRDGDGCQGWQDADRDGDGFANVRDACPDSVEVNWIPGPGNDANLDGCIDTGDAAPPDADHDGVRDDRDWCSPGRTGWTSTAATDHDGDGCRDVDEDWNDDNDNAPDELDACPRGMSFDGWIAEYGGDYDNDGSISMMTAMGCSMGSTSVRAWRRRARRC
ncbi:MAG: hypothetical protein JNJ59_10865, partial [Deltaproteobacteria bacterium]|nr:hypothetical protein [Deltaproteobacteria bacterium]